MQLKCGFVGFDWMMKEKACICQAGHGESNYHDLNLMLVWNYGILQEFPAIIHLLLSNSIKLLD